MKKVAFGLLLCAFSVTADPQEVVAPEEELQELEQPNKGINGAYWGVGLGIARTHHKLNGTKTVAPPEPDPDDPDPAPVPAPDVSGINPVPRSTAAQIEASVLLGFGTSIWSKYYTGLELEFFRRFSGKTSHFNEIRVEHSPNTSFNFEGRFGYLFPKEGNLLFVTAGVSRLFSRAYFEYGNGAQKATATFGSFFPTIGIGYEHRINATWNVRFDCRYVITSKEHNQKVQFTNPDTNYTTTYNYDAKPERMSFRISIIRNINHSLY